MTTPICSQSPVWRTLVFAAVPLASFLSFSVQPVIGKFLVPWHGGSASTWIGTMLFFQAALLLGYLWAYWIGARSLSAQIRATIALAVVAAAATWVPPPRLLDTGGMSEVLLSLTVALLPAMVLLFSVGLLLQAWVARQRGHIPYYLYSVSNFGSLGALVIYPFWIEPKVGLGVQAMVWRLLLVLLAALVVVIAVGLRHLPAMPASVADPAADDNESPGRKLAWLGLSALTCICMLGATRHLSAEIGSNPLSWIIPLGLYLASFSIAFAGWWREGASLICLALLGVSLSGFTLLKGLTALPISGWSALWFVLVVGSACFLGNGVLYTLRPKRQFLQYYVVIGVGGMIGGIFSSLSAPNLFTRNFEFLGAASLLLVIGLVRLAGVKTWRRMVAAVVVIGAPIVGTCWVQVAAETTNLRRVHNVRNIYGHIQVIQNPNQVVLQSETTLHGLQQVQSESARRRPTLYYVESSGVGTALRQLQEKKPALSVGVVGLGAGTLAVYAREADTFTFWDLDPKVMWIARSAFSFLADARGTILLEENDGRKAIEQSTATFDLLVIDAFSGDSIPAHLLTVEALRSYVARLRIDDGVLLVHASNRYVELFPVIAANAQAIGWEALRVHTTITRPGEDRDIGPSTSNYIVVHRPAQRMAIDAWYPREDDGGRVTRELSRMTPDDPLLVRWTDDRNSIGDVLQWKRYMKLRD